MTFTKWLLLQCLVDALLLITLVFLVVAFSTSCRRDVQDGCPRPSVFVNRFVDHGIEYVLCSDMMVRTLDGKVQGRMQP